MTVAGVLALPRHKSMHDTGVESNQSRAGVKTSLLHIISILRQTSTAEGGAVEEVHNACETLLSKILVGNHEAQILELSLIALNLSFHHKLLSAERAAISFRPLLMFIRGIVCSGRFFVENALGMELPFHLALVALRQLICRCPLCAKSTDGVIKVVRGLVTSVSAERSQLLEPQVQEDMIQLAICLVKLIPGDTFIDLFFINWSLKTLDGCPISTVSSSLHLSLLILDLALETKNLKLDAEKNKKLVNRIVSSGIIKIVWLLLHPQSDIQNLSNAVLTKLVGPRDKMPDILHINLKDLFVVKIMLQQSAVPVLLCVKETMMEDCCVLDHIIDSMRQTLYGILGKDDNGIQELVDSDDSDKAVQACAGLLLTTTLCTRSNEEKPQLSYRDWCKNLVWKVLDILLKQPDTNVMVFWQAVEYIVRIGIHNTNTESDMSIEPHDHHSGDVIEPIVVLFRSHSHDNSLDATEMECPSLSELNRLAPKLGQLVSYPSFLSIITGGDI